MVSLVFEIRYELVLEEDEAVGTGRVFHYLDKAWAYVDLASRECGGKTSRSFHIGAYLEESVPRPDIPGQDG